MAEPQLIPTRPFFRALRATPGALAAEPPRQSESPQSEEPLSSNAVQTAVQQSIRVRRFLMAATATGVVMAILLIFLALGLIAPRGVGIVLAVQIGLLAGFYQVFRSGLNLRFRDPSLTIPQMVGAIFALHIAMANARGGHAVLSMLYLLPFLFGTLRLSTLQMLGLTAFVLAGDLAVLFWDRDHRLGGPMPNVEWLRLASLVFVLVWVSWIGGYLSGLRRRLRQANEQLSQAVRTIRHMASHDELTAIHNRRYLVETLQTERARADRYGGTFSVCLMDLDHFKSVNDALGHAGGDVVLRVFARAVEAAKRPIDTFGRYGGEEFMLILPQTDCQSAAIALERMRVLIENLAFEGLDAALRVTVSVGVAEHRRGDDWQRTVERADEALYRAKVTGRNRVEIALEARPPGNAARLRPRDPQPLS